MEDGKQKINIELSPEVAEGIYSNLAVITHSPTEFVIDFVRVMPGVSQANVKSRIILTPDHAKRLLGALKDNIDKFDREQSSSVAPFPINFGNKSGQA